MNCRRRARTAALASRRCRRTYTISTAAPESDGGPCRWFFRGQYFDYYHTANQACFASVVQPFFDVNKRRYRFRLLDAGPSRFYELFLTDPLSPNTVIPFWMIANDGDLLPKPLQVTSVRLGVAERADIIIDFDQVKRLIGS